MLDAKKLFQERLSDHFQQLSRYLRYIFNGHIAVASFFLISALAVFYQQWLATLSKDFPAGIIIGSLFGIIAAYNPIRSLLKRPDLMFLIAAESQLHSYFRRTIIYSFVVQIYLVFLIAAVLGPLYFHIYDEQSGKVYLLTIVILLIIKAWNLMANWWMLKLRNKNHYRIHLLIRFFLSTAIFISFIEQQLIIASITTIIFIGLFLLTYSWQRNSVSIPWIKLVELDEQSLQTFYRLANLFTDVPAIKVPVKQRKWLTFFVQRFIPLKNKFTYDYLYRLTFLRSGDYLGMYVRLLIIGSLAIYIVDLIWLKGIFVFLFIYMSSFQMMTLYDHHRTIIWLDLYPVSLDNRQRAFIRLLSGLSYIKALIFTVVFLLTTANIPMFLGVLLISFIFVFLFLNGYVKRKIEKL